MRHLVSETTEQCLPGQPMPVNNDRLPNPQLLLDKWTVVAMDDQGGFTTSDPAARGRSLEQVMEAARRALHSPDGRDFLSRVRRHWPQPAVKCLIGETEQGIYMVPDGQAEAKTLCFELRTSWRMALHLSRPNAMENSSVCLHRNGGFPYLPGAGVKGLARNAALRRLAFEHPGLVDPGNEEQPVNKAVFRFDRLDEQAQASAVHDVLAYSLVFGLGSDEKIGDGAFDVRAHLRPNGATEGPREWSGEIIFWDAMPGIGTELSEDVLTPHFKNYHGKSTPSAPSDDQSPVPISFLTVSGTFAFAVSLRARQSLQERFPSLLLPTPRELLDRAAMDLAIGLFYLGAGAKTAAGYGTFQSPPGQAPTGPAFQPIETDWNDAVLIYAPNKGIMTLKTSMPGECFDIRFTKGQPPDWYNALSSADQRRALSGEFCVKARVRQNDSRDWTLLSVTRRARA